MEQKDQNSDIKVYINSPGGSVTDGLAMIDTMTMVSCDVSTICVGLAASMGAMILMAGTKGKRLILPHSYVLIHQPLGGAQGQATDIEIQARQILKIKDKLSQIMAEKTGRDIEELRKDMERDFYMSAEEAKEYGIIDEVITAKR